MQSFRLLISKRLEAIAAMLACLLGVPSLPSQAHGEVLADSAYGALHAIDAEVGEVSANSEIVSEGGAISASSVAAPVSIVGYVPESLSTTYVPGKDPVVDFAIEFGGTKLVEGADYELAYGEIDLSGGTPVRNITVTGRGSFTDSVDVPLFIRPYIVQEGDVVFSAVADQAYSGTPIEPLVTLTVCGADVSEVCYDVSYTNNCEVGTATIEVVFKGLYSGAASTTFGIVATDGWYDFSDGTKGYGRDGRLVTGWLDLGSAKYWFGEDGKMAVGWTDLEVNGKVMHYYFHPSGNLARSTWATIDGKQYYFRASGNMATGWATISDNGVDKKYWFDESGQMVTGWQDIVNDDGAANRYYFRPSGSMATEWATIDGEKYYFRPSGNMATGFTDVVSDSYKRYFDEQGHMVTGWRDINGNTYYFRSSGAMQTGEAVIDGITYVFNDKGMLVG